MFRSLMNIIRELYLYLSEVKCMCNDEDYKYSLHVSNIRRLYLYKQHTVFYHTSMVCLI